MSGKNRYGLSRYIKDAIKKEVRKRCGFGCVICGSCIYTYEHFNPPFEYAELHDPLGITLLCGDHQTQSFKGLLSKETIAEADRTPKCLRNGYSNHLFDIGQIPPNIYLGSNKLSNVGHVFDLRGKTYFSVVPPEEGSKFWRLNAEFFDSSGIKIGLVKENELRVQSENFQFEQVKSRFEIKDKNEHIIFLLSIRTPTELHIEKCTIIYELVTLTVDGTKVTVNTPTVKNLTFENCSLNNVTIFLKL